MLKIRFTADTPFTRARGLMYSTPLSPEEIAVFKFDNDSSSGFYNKNVSYPIKVAFFSKDFRLVGLKDLSADQLDQVAPNESYRYVAEMANSDSDSIMLSDIKNYLEKTYGDKL